MHGARGAATDRAVLAELMLAAHQNGMLAHCNFSDNTDILVARPCPATIMLIFDCHYNYYTAIKMQGVVFGYSPYTYSAIVPC